MCSYIISYLCSYLYIHIHCLIQIYFNLQVTNIDTFKLFYNQLHLDIRSKKNNQEMTKSPNLSRDNDISALFSKGTIKEKPTQAWPHKFICKEGFNHVTCYHVLSNCLCDAVAASVKLSVADYLVYNLEPNCFLHFTKSFGLGFTKLSKFLEQIVLVLVNLLLICMLKVTIMLFIVMLWCNALLWRNYVKKYLIYLATKGVDSSSLWDHGSLNDLWSVECEAVTHDVQQLMCTEICDIFRSTGKEQARKEIDKNLYEKNYGITENSGLLGSSNQSITTSKATTTKYLPPTESKPLQTTGYMTNKLPGATVSHDQHYETKFDEDTPPLSMEETRKKVRPVPKENDVDSLLQSYQKTPTAVQNTSKPHVQDKTKSPATVPSSSINKSHKSLPRRACLVHHKEQYHLDKNLLSQPRATKYLVKVRTEISPGRYMAKLELQCSRYVCVCCVCVYT